MSVSTVVLIGFKSCGKSTYGPLLAARLQGRCADLDRVLEQRHEAASGERLAAHEIFERHGAAHFAHLEGASLDELCAFGDDAPERPAVLATTGATALSLANVARLRQLGPLVLLDTPRETIRRRWFCGRLPAFVDAADPDASFARLYDERLPAYRSAADFIVATGGATDANVIDTIVALLRGALPATGVAAD
ncbi:shikimate kinase [Burkholderia sp. YIM B11467]